MSLHQAAASHSGSWDEDFYLHVVSGVSTCFLRGNQMKSRGAAQANAAGSVAVRLRTTTNQGTLAFENHPTLGYLTRTQTRS